MEQANWRALYDRWLEDESVSILRIMIRERGCPSLPPLFLQSKVFRWASLPWAMLLGPLETLISMGRCTRGLVPSGPACDVANENQVMLRVVIIKKHLCLPWTRNQVYSSFLAQGKHRGFLIMTALNASWEKTAFTSLIDCVHEILKKGITYSPS